MRFQKQQTCKMTGQTLEQQATERRRIQLNDEYDGKVDIGDILVGEDEELVTDKNAHGVGVLYRWGSDMIKHGFRSISNYRYQVPVERGCYSSRSSDIFERDCYQIADKILTEAEL